MKRFATLLTLAGFTLAACQDNAPTGPGATSAPLAARGDDRGGGNDGPIAVGYTSTRGIKPIAVEGNTTGNGAAECAKYGGGIAVKIEGASNASVAGYSFTVGSGGTTLAFAYQSGGNVISAVLVKGGPAFSVYQYGTPVPNDGNLSSPENGGGNIPTISHYTVCYKPAPPPVIDKKFHSASAGTSMPGKPVTFMEMAGTPCVLAVTAPYAGCLPVLKGETIWLIYKITYSSPLPGTISDDIAAVCSALNNYSVGTNGYVKQNFGCSFGGFYADAAHTQLLGATSYSFGPGSGTVYALIDITNPNECGDRPVVNKATLKAGPFTVSSTETVWIWPEGDACKHQHQS